ncbi:MAG: aminoacyl-histidine dipeptidase [Bacteroides sp.]
MSEEIRKLKPADIWENFYSLTQIPRPSKHEERITAFMVDFGKKLGLETHADKLGNVLIRKPATPGYEDRKIIVLQAHLDMVPQKNSDKQHDFLTDPIDAYIDGDWVRARGTTLGADNGMGVAAAMGVLASKTLKHGPIEALFTIDEETGMTGAENLAPDFLKGRILINLDSETEGELYVGCAGGVDATIHIPYELENTPTAHKALSIEVKGLKGGHSGMDIVLGRGNSIMLLMRLLVECEDLGIRIATAQGGSLRNAIPREAFATVVVPEKNLSALHARIATIKKDIQEELSVADPAVAFNITEVAVPAKCLTTKSHLALTRSVYNCPNGVIRMSDSVAGLVETSTNFAALKMEEKYFTGLCLMRSSVETAKFALTKQMEACFKMVDAPVEFSGAYPGWKPNMESPILKTMKSVYKNKFGNEPKIMAIHAGLECGIIGGIFPGMDMISFGPTILSPHSPDERVNIATVQLFWDFLTEILANSPK